MALFDNIFGNQTSGTDARLGRNDVGFQSQPAQQRRGTVSRQGFADLGGLNLFNATGERFPPGGVAQLQSQEIGAQRLDPNSSFFDQQTHDALDFLSVGNTSGQTLNQLRAAGVNPFQQEAPVGIAQEEPTLGGAAGFNEGFNEGQLGTNIGNAGVTSGGGFQQNIGGGVQQGAAADQSLMALIASLIQSLMTSGQFAAGGGVGQPQQQQAVFRDDLNRLGINRF